LLAPFFGIKSPAFTESGPQRKQGFLSSPRKKPPLWKLKFFLPGGGPRFFCFTLAPWKKAEPPNPRGPRKTAVPRPFSPPPDIIPPGRPPKKSNRPGLGTERLWF